MYHTIKMIAENQFLDPTIAQAVADANPFKYGVTDDGMIGTWYVDTFIKDVKEAQGPVTEDIRRAEIFRQYGHRV